MKVGKIIQMDSEAARALYDLLVEVRVDTLDWIDGAMTTSERDMYRKRLRMIDIILGQLK